MYLRGRLVAIENVAQHLPLTVHARPRLHELPCVLDALPLGTVQTELVRAGGDRQVSGARYDDLGRLKPEGKVRRFQYPGPRRPHDGASRWVLTDHRLRLAQARRARWPDRSDGPVPPQGCGESAPPWRTLRALRTAGRGRGSCGWCRFHSPDRTAACPSDRSMCEPVWRKPPASCRDSRPAARWLKRDRAPAWRESRAAPRCPCTGRRSTLGNTRRTR